MPCHDICPSEHFIVYHCFDSSQYSFANLLRITFHFQVSFQYFLKNIDFTISRFAGSAENDYSRESIFISGWLIKIKIIHERRATAAAI
jgi:hypothetical protein